MIKATTEPYYLVYMCVMLLVSSALCEASFVSSSNRVHRNTGISTGSLKPLQVVDCVLERCMWLSSSRAKRLCIYLLCMRGTDDLMESLDEPLGTLFDEDDDTQSVPDLLLPPGEDEEIGDYPPSHGYEIDSEQLIPQTMNRFKKWQYPDPLQHCVQVRCQGQRGVNFYTCVYKNCIAVSKKGRIATL